ncbi:MAG: SPFH domain-containing protein [Faecalibacterium sp.]|nr:SPFH domain-containing protein [Faecalibacterium sp.]
MGFIKKQMLKVIEWKDDSTDVIVQRFDIPDRYEIMKGSQLTVRESQACIFVNEGKIADVFGPGRYKLETANLPFLTAIYSWKYAFETPFKGDIYFVNTKQFVNQKWGTTNPIMLRDADFGVIRLRGYGIYSYRVVDPKKLMTELTSTNKVYKTETINETFRKVIVSKITDIIGESKLSALDLAMNYNELGEQAAAAIVPELGKFGLEVTGFHIENLSLPEEVEKMIDKRTSMGVIGDKIGTFTQYQTAEAIREAAKNPGTAGTFAGAGIGLGAGIGMGGAFADSLKAAKDENKAAGGLGAQKAVCAKCGASISANAKFCPECGEKVQKKAAFCPECGKPVAPNAKFCPECGTKIK